MRILYLAAVLLSCVVGVGLVAQSADAAPVTFASSTVLSLTSPAIDFTVTAGSVADSVTVNAGSIVVTMSASTGGTFVFTSPRALVISTSGSGGIASESCSDGTGTETVTQSTGSETYTFTPTAGGDVCVPHSPTNGGGALYTPQDFTIAIDGGASATNSATVTLSLFGRDASMMEVSNDPAFAGAAWIPYVTSMPWTLASGSGERTVYARYRTSAGVESGRIQASITRAASTGTTSAGTTSAGTTSAGTTAAPAATASPAPAASTPVTSTTPSQSQQQKTQAASTASTISALLKTAFSRDMTVGSRGTDVKALQLFLVTKNSGPAAAKLSANGTTTYFGPLTQSALREYQKKVGITPTSGYFGPKTRTYLKTAE